MRKDILKLLHQYFLLSEKEERDLFLKQNYLSRYELNAYLVLGYLQVLQYETIPIITFGKLTPTAILVYYNLLKKIYEKEIGEKWDGLLNNNQIVFKNNTNTIKFVPFSQSKKVNDMEVKPILF